MYPSSKKQMFNSFHELFDRTAHALGYEEIDNDNSKNASRIGYRKEL
ncbi:MAG: hypothetical protein ACQER9_04340 [Nanobdellota archaeon]